MYTRSIKKTASDGHKWTKFTHNVKQNDSFVLKRKQNLKANIKALIAHWKVMLWDRVGLVGRAARSVRGEIDREEKGDGVRESEVEERRGDGQTD